MRNDTEKIIIIIIFFNDKLSNTTHTEMKIKYKYNSIGLTVNELKLEWIIPVLMNARISLCKYL